MATHRPTRDELQAASGRALPEILGHGLSVLFCGINPGLYSAVTGHHFARPGNRFWRALHEGGLTERQLHPSEDVTMPARGYGMTNLVARATASAAELSPAELEAGGRWISAVAERFRPRFLAVLGVSAYRAAFRRPEAPLGRQAELLHATVVWVLPSPSGLNAHYSPAQLAARFAELRAALEAGE